MFTGLIEEVGKIRSFERRGTNAVINIEASEVLDDVKIGDSISISGACQTVVSFGSDSFVVEAVSETLSRTKFGNWKRGDFVNLERAVRPMDRLGGHIVQGHVDTIVNIQAINQLEGSWRLSLELPEKQRQYVVEKGSITLDGISLTVAAVSGYTFEVEVIPHSWEHTTLKHLKTGDAVHVEWDVIAKYVENFLTASGQVPGKSSGITMDKLNELGF